MRYVNLTSFQLFLMTLLMGLIAAAFSIGAGMYREYRLLPEVVRNSAGECVKVVNYENGHAFNCTDVNVLLRRYRVAVE